MKYRIGVEVTTSYEVELEADSYENAEAKVEDMEYDEMKWVGETVEYLDLTLLMNEEKN